LAIAWIFFVDFDFRKRLEFRQIDQCFCRQQSAVAGYDKNARHSDRRFGEGARISQFAAKIKSAKKAEDIAQRNSFQTQTAREIKTGALIQEQVGSLAAGARGRQKKNSLHGRTYHNWFFERERVNFYTRVCMELKIKICGITNLDDAQAASDAGADALGFMFYESSPRNISLARAGEIAGRISPFVLKVGVFVDPDPDFVLSAITSCGLNLLQFHGEEKPEFCQGFGVMTMKAFRIKDAASLEQLPNYGTDAWLLDSYVAGKQGGTGEKFNWDMAIEARKLGRPVFLAGGLTPVNIGEAVRKVQPYGVDVSSGVESSPGRKDHEKIRAFITAAREAANDCGKM